MEHIDAATDLAQVLSVREAIQADQQAAVAA
jgi:hypothetical protein